MTNVTSDIHPDSLNGPEPAPAQHVVAALCRVMGELPAIGKTMESPQGYKYRGIEQITQHAQPLFAKHGITLVPHRVQWQEVTNLTINGRPWTDEKLLVTYRCYGPGGVDDYLEVQVPGIGRDNADKGSNKAMTQAFKYAMLQALCIADAKDDADSHDVPQADDDTGPVMATRLQVGGIREACATLRSKGEEVTETNDVGEVKVLGVQMLHLVDGHLVPALTTEEADALLARLADAILEWQEPVVEGPGTAAARAALEKAREAADASEEEEPAPEPTEPEPPQERVVSDREKVARDALARATGDGPAPSSRRDTRGQLKPAEGEDDRTARMRQRVNSLPYQDVHDQLAALGKDVNGKPQAVRQRLLDHLLSQVAQSKGGR
jgi:hypothetical protein